ncbi:PAS domain S-box protein [Halopiger djelfimassiliensis]|uniref:PAS domain S-box protein n=1 Tax=Halopiger djelfimassiliensis TaxID=1293047 RepID=UPI000677AFA0|nr:PAS domain S-box protein [Halopiger djelfimassiliensis]
MNERTESPNTNFWGGDTEGSEPGWCRALVETIDEGVFRLDDDDRIVAVDDTLLETTGYRRDEVVGEHVSVLVSEAASEQLEGAGRPRRRTARDDGPSSRLEVSLRTAEGNPVPAVIKLTGVRSDGRFRGAVGVVDERRQSGIETEPEPTPTESATGSPFEAATTVLEDADVGVFVLDDEFDVAWINETIERYFGLDRAAVLGRDKRQLIEETITDRVADPEAFANAVVATYDDNSYVERFECRVTGDDGEKRWLEHRSRPIESGPYAGGRVELYYDVTEQHERVAQLRRLHEAVHEWLAGDSREAVAETASRQIQEIFQLDINGIFLYDPDAEELQPAGWSERAESLFEEIPRFRAGEGVAWRVFESGEPAVHDDVTTDPDVYNPETPIRSEICLPIGDHGVVLIGSQQRTAFDDANLSIANVVTSSLEATFDRIEHERQLERERAQTEKLLKSVPIGISVEDADGETVLANQRIQDRFGLSSREGLGETELIEEWDVYDAATEPLSPDAGPAAHVRETGEPVFDRELMVEGPTGERRWLSVNAVPVFGSDDTLERVVASAEDITALKERKRQIEQRKNELESELREIFGRISDGFYALDEEWRFTHVNEHAKELLGYSSDELIGSVVWEVFPGTVGSDLFERYIEAMETQQSVSWERYSESLDRWLEIQAYPSETGLSVYFRDITERKERIRKLEESEQRYRTLAEHFPNGVVTLYNEELEYTLADGKAFDDLSLSGADLEGQRPTDVFPEPIGSKLETAFERTLDGESQVIEDEYDGKVWRVHTAPLTDDEGEVFAGMAMSQNVTEHRERERALAKYETLVETMEDGVYTIDGAGEFTAVNEAYTELTGYDREELLGSHASLVADEPAMERAQQVAEDDDETSTVEAELETKSGDRVPVEATVTGFTTDENGRERVGVVRDVSERKERRRRLEESEQRYRTLAENFPNGLVALFDEGLRYTAAGGELIDELGIDRTDAIGRPITERYSEEFLAEVEPHFRAALEGEERSFEVTYHGRELLAHTLPVRAGGEIQSGMLVVQDVTERKEYERKLEASNERLEQFAYAASHDLQEPLRMVTSYLGLIEQRYADALDEDGEEFIQFAVDGAERMSDMIDGLLEYSRVETRGEPFEPVDLRDVVEDVRRDLELQIAETDAEITVESLPRVRGDGNQLRQVFQNLVANALEYSGDESPRVTVSAERDGTEWVISVSDEGIGIDPADADRIFEIFQRLHSREEHDGTGLGLTLCRRIIERHGGRIWVESEPGEGTTFSMTLPAIDGPDDSSDRA